MNITIQDRTYKGFVDRKEIMRLIWEADAENHLFDFLDWNEKDLSKEGLLKIPKRPDLKQSIFCF